MIPTLHLGTAIPPRDNGLGLLTDALTCKVTEERNGKYELDMRYPIYGALASEIQPRRMIQAKPNQYDAVQLFRIDRVAKNLQSQTLQVHAVHLSYDLGGYPVMAFSATGVPYGVFSAAQKNAINQDIIFSFSSDISTKNTVKFDTPVSLMAVLKGVRGSILDVFGGELRYTNDTQIRLMKARGADRGVSLRYGQNLASLELSDSSDLYYDSVIGFWASADNAHIVYSGKVRIPGVSRVQRTKILDLSADFTSPPSSDQLSTKARAWAVSNHPEKIRQTLRASYADTATSSYDPMGADVRLCDTVSVVHPSLGVNRKEKVVRVVYDSLLERIQSATVGDLRRTIVDTIGEHQEQINELNRR